MKTNGKNKCICCANLQRFHHEGQDFLSCIVTGDETWVYSWDPKLKRQSAQWHKQGSPHPKKAQHKQGAMKVMHIIFFDAAGILVNWAVPAGITINTAYYKWVLQEKLCPAIRKKWSGLVEHGLIFHHDNAPVHMQDWSQIFLTIGTGNYLVSPGILPIWLPTNFYLFPKMRETLYGRHFGSTDEINEATSASL